MLLDLAHQGLELGQPVGGRRGDARQRGGVVGDLSRQGLLARTEDQGDRRRKLISIAEAHRAAIDAWLGGSASAWRRALEPMTPAERRLVVDTLARFERELP